MSPVIILNDVVLPAPLTPSSLKHYANAQRYANAQLADCHEVTVELILLAHDDRVGLNETVDRCVVDNAVSLAAIHCQLRLYNRSTDLCSG